MFARVINGIVQSGKIDELVSLVNDQIGPRVSQRSGSRGMLLLIDEGTRHAISISLWDSKEAMMDGETGAFLNDQLSQVLPLMEEAPSTRNFRVSARFE